MEELASLSTQPSFVPLFSSFGRLSFGPFSLRFPHTLGWRERIGKLKEMPAPRLLSIVCLRCEDWLDSGRSLTQGGCCSVRRTPPNCGSFAPPRPFFLGSRGPHPPFIFLCSLLP